MLPKKKNTDLFYPCSTENSEKNRYTNIRQFTHNFYQFSTDKLRYINASVMLSGEYILAQGPLADTVQDFWDMVWDSGADTVVMATNLVDSGRIKCDLYWPSSPSSPLELDSITIDLKKSKERQFNGFSSLYTIREFTLTKGDEQRVVHQYHFKDWPDHAVHPSLDLILDAITAIDNRHDNRGPLVVHCSAGVGRSGVFLICHLLNQLHNFYKSQGQAVEIDITALVKLLRTPPYGRHMTIMTKSQFQMLYTFCEHLQAKRAELE